MPAAPKKQPSAKPAAKAPKGQAASPAYNPNDPFQQVWEDQTVEGDSREQADSLHHSKRMLAHSYMSSKADMTMIRETFSDTPVDSFVIRAAAKAFKATLAQSADEPLNVSRVVRHGERIAYYGVQDLRVGQLAD